MTHAGVQVSLEDAEILMGTAERINIAGQPSCAPYMVLPKSHTACWQSC